MVSQIFMNLPVKNLEKTKKFFSALGFTFNPQFSDENAVCVILGENLYAMLLLEKFFKGFVPHKELCDFSKNTEVINAIHLGSREEVDAMMDKALAAGAKQYRDPEDHGWMYGRAFEDIDGHLWEPFVMDVSKAPAVPGKAE